MPGPVSYGLGGMEPTLTDSYLALGFLDPDYFMGGQKSLDKDSALEIIESEIASPLGITTEKASFEIKEYIKRKIGDESKKLIEEKGLNPQDVTLFAFGGGGGCLCCDVAEYVGIPRIYLFPQSAVFCAFGSSMMDILHIYEDGTRITLRSGSGEYLSDFDEYNGIIAGLQEKSFRDMRGEGFKPEDIHFLLELEINGETGKEPVIIEHPDLFLQDKKDVEALCARYAGTASGNNDAVIEVFRLRATCVTPHYKFTTFPRSGDDPGKALKGKRDVYWGEKFIETDVYDRKLLENGNIVKGPAIIEAEDTTYIIPSGRKYSVDQYLNGIIEEV